MNELLQVLHQLGEQYTLEASLHEADTFEDWLNATGYYPFLLSVTSQYSTDLADAIEAYIMDDNVESWVKDELQKLSAEDQHVLYDQLQELLSDFVAHSIHANAALQATAKVVTKDDGYYVESEKGRNLGGPYSSKKKAEERLAEVEMFKAMDKQAAINDPQYEEKQANYIIEQVNKVDEDVKVPFLQNLLQYMMRFGQPLSKAILDKISQILGIDAESLMTQHEVYPVMVGTGSVVGSKKSKLVFANDDARYYAIVPSLTIWLFKDELEYDDEIKTIKASTMALADKIVQAKEKAKEIVKDKIYDMFRMHEVDGTVNDIELDETMDRIDWEALVGTNNEE